MTTKLIQLKMKIVSIFIFILSLSSATYAQKTFCNPMNLDYGFTPIPNFSEQGRHRAGR